MNGKVSGITCHFRFNTQYIYDRAKEVHHWHDEETSRAPRRAFIVSDRVAAAVKEAIARKERPIKYYEPTPEALYKVNHGEGGTR